jgi:hypothetical protein
VAYVVEPATSPHPGSIRDRVVATVGRIGNDPLFHVTLDFFSVNHDVPPTYPPANSAVVVANGAPQLLEFRDTYAKGIFLPAQVWAQAAVGDPPTPALDTSWGRIKTSYR